MRRNLSFRLPFSRTSPRISDEKTNVYSTLCSLLRMTHPRSQGLFRREKALGTRMRMTCELWFASPYVTPIITNKRAKVRTRCNKSLTLLTNSFPCSLSTFNTAARSSFERPRKISDTEGMDLDIILVGPLKFPAELQCVPLQLHCFSSTKHYSNMDSRTPSLKILSDAYSLTLGQSLSPPSYFFS